tara:strand:- start:1714 stop:2172 length:459 start_codon:yes stop_codon:yes gene_type:complete
MKFGEAIDSVLVKNYFNFQGKASRAEYWWFVLFLFVSSVVVSFTEAVAVGISQGADFDPENFYPYFFTLYMIFLVLPSLSVTVRRFHDAGRGTMEAVVLYFVAQISSIFIPNPNGLFRAAESLESLVLIAFLTSGIYTLYITLKKSEEISEE